MRTMMIANSLVTDGAPTAAGAIGLKDALGNACDFVASPANRDVNGVFQFIGALGNGSVKTFTVNPNNFNFHYQESGSATSVTPKYTITYPTGNVNTDSFGMQFVGGIVVKKLDRDKNVYNTKYIKAIEVIGTNGVVTAADAVVAFKAGMAALISTTNMTLPIYSATHTFTTSTVYLLNSNDWYIELTGDLRWFDLVKVQGVSLANTGADAVKFERELAPNSGFHYSEWDTDLYDKSNFIADATKVYDIVTVISRATAQRPLLPNAAGFDTTLHIYVEHSAKAAVYDKIVTYLAALKASNGAAIDLA